MSTKKNFILDTNVVLHDYKAIYNFQENDIYLPMVVLEELDKFKRGNDQINYNSRQFARELDLIAENKDFVTKGAPLGEGKGKLYVITHQEWPEEMNRAFIEKKPDHIILACAISIAKKFPKQQTILVTKDINLRMKARAMGCIAEDYISDKVENTDVFEKEYETFNNVDADLIDRLYSEKQGITADDFNFKDDITANECFVMKSSRASILARHVAESNIIRRVNKTRCFGIEPRNAEQTFAMDLLTDKHIQLIAITGKT